MYKYKNVSDSEQSITADGEFDPRIVAPGEETIASVPLENPNFQYVGETAQEKADSAQVQAVQERNPAKITGPAQNEGESN